VHGKVENSKEPGCQWGASQRAAIRVREADQIKCHIVSVKDVVGVVVARPLTVLRRRLGNWWEYWQRHIGLSEGGRELGDAGVGKIWILLERWRATSYSKRRAPSSRITVGRLFPTQSALSVVCSNMLLNQTRSLCICPRWRLRRSGNIRLQAMRRANDGKSEYWWCEHKQALQRRSWEEGDVF
jgi:hypothetical protein